MGKFAEMKEVKMRNAVRNFRLCINSCVLQYECVSTWVRRRDAIFRHIGVGASFGSKLYCLYAGLIPHQASKD